MSETVIAGIKALSESTTTVGLKFVYAEKNRLDLYIFFYPSGAEPDTILGTVSVAQISIFSPPSTANLGNDILDQAFEPSWETLVGCKVLHIRLIRPVG